MATKKKVPTKKKAAVKKPVKPAVKAVQVKKPASIKLPPPVPDVDPVFLPPPPRADVGLPTYGSEQQNAIWDAILNSPKHLVVDALAGSGKSFTIRHGAAALPRRLKIGVVAFNVHIARDMTLEFEKMRVGHVKAFTYNSFGWRSYRAAYPRAEVMVDKLDSLIEGMLDEGDFRRLVSPLAKLVRLLKCHLYDGTQDEIDELMAKFDMDIPPADEGLLKMYAPRLLKKCLDQTEVVDYDDQIWMTVKLNLPIEQFDVLMVDEAQDTSLMQQEMAFRATQRGRVIVVGDRHQCQPADTQVMLPSGEFKSIADIVEGDEVVSFNDHPGNSTRAKFVGRFRKRPHERSQGRKVLATARRHYAGPMFQFEAAGYITRCTPNHRMVAQARSEKEQYVTYLMRRGQDFRVGWCSLFRETGELALGYRARLEGADAAWVLAVHDDKQSASFEEVSVSLRFQIPQVMFREVPNNSLYTQEKLDEFWAQLPKTVSPKWHSCLLSYGRDYEHPFWEPSTRIGTKYIFKITASNFLPEAMQVPVLAPDSDEPFWVKPQVTVDALFTGDVFSLEVETHHSYIADGILVGNSIFGFRGADVDSIPRMSAALGKTDRGVETLPLSVSRRCPTSHIALAQAIVPEITALPDAPLGIVETLSEEAALQMMRPGDLALCRVNAPLISCCYTLIKRGVKAIVRGRDIGKGILTLVRKLRATAIPDLIEKVRAWEEKETRKLSADKKGQSRLLAMQDRVQCVIALSEGADSIQELEARVNRMFSDFDDEGKPLNAVVFGTVHRTKGLEAPHVYVLAPALIPHPMAKQPWEQQQEKNLAYVAVTRAKFFPDGSGGRLVFCGQIPPAFGGPALQKKEWKAPPTQQDLPVNQGGN